MKCIVTGAAGFVGSHLCEELLRQGNQVTGVDALIAYYPEIIKQRNLIYLMANPNFRCYRLDLRTDPLDAVMAGADVVFHLAGMPGLSASWTDFDLYWTCNILATQRLLESIRKAAPTLKRFVYASSSSVYGRFAVGGETMPTNPISPYGVTKLAGEKLCHAYADGFGLPLVILRYFSVYGPRQRTDMGYFQFINALLRREPVVVYGDGKQFRGNTYVSDCVRATIGAVQAPSGEVYNVGGSEAASVWDILAKLKDLSGRQPIFKHKSARVGDQLQTLADTTKLRRHIGWKPTTFLDEGLARQWEWQTKLDVELPPIDTSNLARMREDKGLVITGTPDVSKRTAIPRKNHAKTKR